MIGVGDTCRYVPKEFFCDVEFAKKVFNKDTYGSELKYFSDEIRNDIEICKLASCGDYPHMSEKIRKNKEIALELGANFSNINYVDKDLRKDQDIIKRYWSDVKEKICDYFCCLCSVISIDNFGNEIIDEFLKIEKTRHSKKRISKFEEKIELTQFVKIKECQNDEEAFIHTIEFDKEIFDKELQTFIILIGEKENAISREIKEEYEENCIIEIYTQEVDTYNCKLITKDTNKIIDLLRVITYINSPEDDIISENYIGLVSIKEVILNEQEKNNIEIYKCKGSLQEITQIIKSVPKNFINKDCIIQIVGNDKLNDYICMNIVSKIYQNRLWQDNTGYIASHICNIENIEIIIMNLS